MDFKWILQKKWKLFRLGSWNITTYHDLTQLTGIHNLHYGAILGPPRPFGTAEFAMWPICFTAWSSSPVDVDIPRAFSHRFMASMSEAHVCVWVTPELHSITLERTSSRFWRNLFCCFSTLYGISFFENLKDPFSLTRLLLIQIRDWTPWSLIRKWTSCHSLWSGAYSLTFSLDLFRTNCTRS